MKRELPLRILVEHPSKGVVFRLQRGRKELAPPTEASDERLVFELTVRVAGDLPGGALNLRGAFAQGPPAGRFVYVSSGTSAGQHDSCWTRRAKVPLAGITRELATHALSDPETVLEARITSTARDGGPACATVPLLDGGWQIATRRAPS